MFSRDESSPCPTNGRQTVGDGAAIFNTDSNILAVCHLEGANKLYYYSTTFSGGPGAKCPPDGGSSSCVTGSLTSISPPSQNSFTASLSHITCNPLILSANPILRQQPTSNSGTTNNSDISTPPLTPDSYDHGCYADPSTTSTELSSDALDFLLTLFPRHGLLALPHSKSITISAPHLGATFDGVILELPGESRMLYVDGKNSESVNLRESIVALLDLADERLGCSGLVIVLESACPSLGALLHALMYVGGAVVTRPPFEVNTAFVLVGLEV